MGRGNRARRAWWVEKWRLLAPVLEAVVQTYVETAQPAYHLFRREIEADIAPYALERFRSGRLLRGQYGSGAVS